MKPTFSHNNRYRTGLTERLTDLEIMEYENSDCFWSTRIRPGFSFPGGNYRSTSFTGNVSYKKLMPRILKCQYAPGNLNHEKGGCHQADQDKPIRILKYLFIFCLLTDLYLFSIRLRLPKFMRCQIN